MIDFQTRCNRDWLYTVKILRLLASGGGFPILIGLLMILSLFAYAELIQVLTSATLIIPVLAGVTALVINSHPYRTWIKAPDIVFLMPMEYRLSDYFAACFRYNLWMQLIRIGALFALFFPIYQLYIGNRFTFLLSLIILVGYQVIQTHILWYRLILDAIWFKISLFFFHFIFVYLLLAQHWLWLMIAIVFMLALSLYLKKIIPIYPFPWIKMIKQEQERIAFYHRIAGWFIDLPHTKQSIQHQRLLIRVLRVLEKKQQPLSFLFWRRFLRDRDYLYPYLYGIMIASFFMWIFPHPYMHISIFVFNLILFAVQFPALAHPDQYPIWLRLYPKQTTNGLTQVSLVLLGLQVSLLACIAWLVSQQLRETILLFLIGWIFNFIYSFWYLSRKQEEKDNT